MLKETGLLWCKPFEIPTDPTCKLGLLKESKCVDQGRYEKLVRKLIYLSITRPSIAYSVSVVSQFMHSPNEEHLEVVYQVLKYLKGSPKKG